MEAELSRYRDTESRTYHLHSGGVKGARWEYQAHKIGTADRRADRQMETGALFLRFLGVMKGPENVKVESQSTDLITILTSLTLGK